ncbi:MAG: polysaccharide pyruvyl transferase family protein [Agriterribacter sp.]
MSQKRKIGILTHFDVCNFGANLQALSTASYLRDNGYSPLFIHWGGYQENLLNGVSEQQFVAHKSFVEKYLPSTSTCYNDEDIRNAIKNESIDAIVVGSDAVLTYKPFFDRFLLTKKGIVYTKPNQDYLFPNPHWLSFFNDEVSIPAALMSPSSQNSVYWMINPSLKQKMGKQLQKFSYLSARDTWTKNMIQYLNPAAKDVPVTPDPVFAFNQNVRQDVTKDSVLKKFNLPEKYVLVSFHKKKQLLPGEAWLKEFREIGSKLGIATVELPMPKGNAQLNLEYQITNPLDPLDWYNLIRFSDGYVGHLMHPIIVSLHNTVPCFSFDTYGFTMFKYFKNYTSSKIYDIFNTAQLLQNWEKAENIFKTTPQKVWDALTNFDKSKCEKFINNKLADYNKMWLNITAAINSEKS